MSTEANANTLQAMLQVRRGTPPYISGEAMHSKQVNDAIGRIDTADVDPQGQSHFGHSETFPLTQQTPTAGSTSDSSPSVCRNESPRI